jgi:hypothetical protein
MLKMAEQFVRAVVPGVVKPLHVLWNELIGFIFSILAISAAPTAWRYYRGLDADPKNAFRLLLTLAFGLTMAWFGVASFLKARRIGRRQVSVSLRR